MDAGEWRTFPLSIARSLEMAWGRLKDEVKYRRDGVEYAVDFQAMTQTRLDVEGATSSIRRVGAPLDAGIVPAAATVNAAAAAAAAAPPPPSIADQHLFLDFAKSYNFAKVRELVEEDIAYVNVQPAGRWTALHQACSSGDSNIVEFLLRKGAETKVTTRDGETPRAVAHRHGHTACRAARRPHCGRREQAGCSRRQRRVAAVPRLQRAHPAGGSSSALAAVPRAACPMRSVRQTLHSRLVTSPPGGVLDTARATAPSFA